MKVRAIYAGRTYSFGKKEAIEYAILNERDIETSDVAILSREPRDHVIRFADAESGWAEKPTWEVRDALLIVEGNVRMVPGTGILRMEKVRVAKAIEAKKIVEAVLKKAKELEEKKVIAADENKVIVDDIEIRVHKFKPAKDITDIENTINNIYMSISAASRRRAMLAAPAFVEITTDNEDGEGSSGWYVVPLPRVLHYVRDNPDSLVAAGVIDEDGFKAPFFIIVGMTKEDLGEVTEHRPSIEWLDRILGAGATAVATSIFEGAEETGLGGL